MSQTPILTVIRAESGAGAYWHDLWRYRELFFFLAWRDVLVRYKQTAIGIAWALLRPLLTMAVFVVVFSKLAKLPGAGDAPYALLVFSALLPWQLFATAVAGSAESLTGNSNMVSKVYFPRLIMPISAVAPSLVDFLISLMLLAGLFLFYGFVPGPQILVLPFFLFLLLLLSSAIGILLSALNVSYRDFRYIVPFLLQIGLYLSPVGYGSTIVPEKWQLLYALNPLVGIIDGFRWALLDGQQELHVTSIALSITVTSILLLLALRYFRSVELHFADRI